MTHVTIPMQILRETEKAILASGCFERPNDNYGINCWIPKSIIVIENRNQETNYLGQSFDIAQITLPTWFTRKNTIQMNDPKAHYAK